MMKWLKPTVSNKINEDMHGILSVRAMKTMLRTGDSNHVSNDIMWRLVAYPFATFHEATHTETTTINIFKTRTS